MNAFTELCSSLYYYRFNIRIAATKNTILDAWPGAILRNNLLYAAEQVIVEKTKKSLRETINILPIKESHPLYKELQEGFPRGYLLSMLSHAESEQPYIRLSKGEILSFSLILVGSMANYSVDFIRAIRQMCNAGLGKPQNPFLLIDICEQSLQQESQIIAVERTNLSNQLRFPIRLSDFMQEDHENTRSEICIRYQTPVILFRPRNKKNPQISYQDKCNRFPSFYQLARSAAFRLSKLHAIYMSAENESLASFDENFMESFLEKAALPLLESADIRYISLKNTLKKEGINTMPLAGYIGQQTYSGYFDRYRPILKFMEGLGVGNETVYGMGRYKLEEREK